ncbi:hypothetical protein J421_5157 (plasmid) [Gemmatirosa kalamazoonensis]|uniref:Lipoprotein n=1 Tax=Gemmatirosa kalamazoonensis TaxID=861299 RepID=W0RQG5_9BACT|nr:hypothetical protein [Gemmatirosa kalamazoonensis]AHG92692.1 hypothetical protein J421_5157 [Gemmatirosa kalamazoonensis]
MSLRHAERSPEPRRLSRAAITLLIAACAEGGSSVGGASAGAQPPRVAVVDSVRVPLVDSAEAARRATVQDTMPLPPRDGTPRDTAGRDTARGDTTPRPARLGPKSGDRHPAFKGVDLALDSLWPVKNAPAPLPGSILPAKRIVAFYGNPKSKRMGILGEFPADEMLRKLDAEVAAWNAVDPAHPVQPALHVIVLVADAQPGPSGKYRTRHDSAMIEKVYGWARSRNALLFVDLQVGQSTLQAELPWIEKFLVRPDVHLGIDPEFSMKNGGIPGRRIGTYDAADINYASRFLSNLVEKHGLPPKILVVHRFTPAGVTHADKIALDPNVQIVMDMDGFGPPWMKRDTYWRDIKREPVQFAGWKQFTKRKNDKPPTSRAEILRLWPVPLYIQIQ